LSVRVAALEHLMGALSLRNLSKSEVPDITVRFDLTKLKKTAVFAF